jgi:hypothetical protein
MSVFYLDLHCLVRGLAKQGSIGQLHLHPSPLTTLPTPALSIQRNCQTGVINWNRMFRAINYQTGVINWNRMFRAINYQTGAINWVPTIQAINCHTGLSHLEKMKACILSFFMVYSSHCNLLREKVWRTTVGKTRFIASEAWG